MTLVQKIKLINKYASVTITTDEVTMYPLTNETHLWGNAAYGEVGSALSAYIHRMALEIPDGFVRCKCIKELIINDLYEGRVGSYYFIDGMNRLKSVDSDTLLELSKSHLNHFEIFSTFE